LAIKEPESLESSLGLRFKDRGLLKQALVHRSFLNEQGGSSLDSYERMEFLGDAVLELVISTELYHNLPRVTEGELTKGRSALVCRPSLAKVARRLSLGDYLSLGKGEKGSGGQQRESILEEVFESVVAAVYLDQGYEAARRFILSALEPELSDYCRQGKTPENPKSQLQETLQGQGISTPRYQVVSIDGPDHQPRFTVAVLVDDKVLAQGMGSKKADAERAAAQEALAQYEASHQISPETREAIQKTDTPSKQIHPPKPARRRLPKLKARHNPAIPTPENIRTGTAPHYALILPTRPRSQQRTNHRGSQAQPGTLVRAYSQCSPLL
jgi:ribonuclease-3